MSRIFRYLVIMALALFAIVVFYHHPQWIVDQLYPSHFNKPRDPTTFWLFVLGATGGIIAILVHIGFEKKK